jgi:hypothetical protein
MGSEVLSSVERSLADDQITKINAPAPSICVFDVNETLLDIEFIAPLFSADQAVHCGCRRQERAVSAADGASRGPRQSSPSICLP